MKDVWRGQLPHVMKLRFFHAAIKTILLYGCKAWSLTKAMTKSLDGCYTRMVHMVQNVIWKGHRTNQELYGGLPKISETLGD